MMTDGAPAKSIEKRDDASDPCLLEMAIATSNVRAMRDQSATRSPSGYQLTGTMIKLAPSSTSARTCLETASSGHTSTPIFALSMRNSVSIVPEC